MEPTKEVFQLPVGHARRGEVVHVGVGTCIVVHLGKGLVFVLLGDGEGVRHYVGYYYEACDFAEQFSL